MVLAGFILILGWSGTGFASAQDRTGVGPASSDGGAATTPAPAPEPTAIPAAVLASEWQRTQSKLKSIQESVVERSETREIQKKLEGIEGTIEDLADTDGLDLTATITPDRLTTLQSNWQRRANTYSGWTDDLSARLQDLSDDLNTLDALDGPVAKDRGECRRR